jgi:hypothetical protein
MATKFTDAVKTFIDSADWLGDADQPAVVALEVAAAQLDKEFTAATLSQYRLLYNGMVKARPEPTPEVDPLTALLDERESD